MILPQTAPNDIDLDLLVKCSQFHATELEKDFTKYNVNEKYLIIKLDGIGMKRKYLNSQIHDRDFQEIIEHALRDTYFVTHRRTPTDAQQIYLGAIASSDEVTFIFNKVDNYYHRDMNRIVSTITSTFTAFFIKESYRWSKAKNTKPYFGAFQSSAYLVTDLDRIIDFVASRCTTIAYNQIKKEVCLKSNGEVLMPKNLSASYVTELRHLVDEYEIDIEKITKYFASFFICKEKPEFLRKYCSRDLPKILNNFRTTIYQSECDIVAINNSANKSN